MSRRMVNLRDDLMRRAWRITGVKKKVRIVNLALEEVVRQSEARKILELAGKVKWEGDLKEMRKDRRIDFSR